MHRNTERSLESVGDIGSAAEDKLAALCSALDWPDVAVARDTLRRLLEPIRALRLNAEPSWQTDLTDDGTPFEFSIAFGEQVELRLLSEAQGEPFDLQSNWREGLLCNAALAQLPGVALHSFERIAERFAPTPSSRGSFALWHGANLDPQGGAPAFKLYLNPQLHGESAARDLVRHALQTLGLHSGWEFLERHPPAARERFLYLSLDASAEPSARVKVYIAHDGLDLERLERLYADTNHYRTGELTQWLERALGPSPAPAERPLLTCLSFNRAAAPQGTLHVPLRCHVSDDEQALERACGLLDPDHAQRLARCVQRWTPRPLASSSGMITYVSFRREQARTRTTVYLAPQLYANSVAPAPPRRAESFTRELALPGHSAAGDTMRVVHERIESQRRTLAQHAFIRRLDRPGTFAALRAMAPQLTFFVLAFQDMLRLARQHAEGGPLAELARAHEREDRGHEQWFLHDLDMLEVARDLRWVFSPEHARTRDVGYALVAELLHARDDRARLAVLLALEAAGAEFFGRTIAYLERLGRGARLQYFARQHQQIEQNHSVFEADEQERLWSVSLPSELRAEVLRSVDRTFEYMTRLANDLDEVMASAEDTQVAS